MKKQYYLPMDDLTPTQWISRCAQRLHDRWRSVEPSQLEEVAVGIWLDPKFRAMDPGEAASTWLVPIGGIDS